jgi:hypothetical protein
MFHSFNHRISYHLYKPSINFGIITAAALTIALIADLFMLPAVFSLIGKEKAWRSDFASSGNRVNSRCALIWHILQRAPIPPLGQKGF